MRALFLPTMLFMLILYSDGSAIAQNPSSNTRKTSPSLTLDHETGQLILRARIYSSQYDTSRKISGHHLIVWKDGAAANKALFRTESSDAQVAQALRRLGAKPGQNLTKNTWNRRRWSSHPDPKIRTEGSPLSISVRFIGTNSITDKALPIQSLIQRTGRQEPLDIRFSGNEQFIDYFQSGCITCLYSCPGAKTSNHTATIRDQQDETVRFSLQPQPLPKDGTVVLLIFQIEDASRKTNLYSDCQKEFPFALPGTVTVLARFAPCASGSCPRSLKPAVRGLRKIFMANAISIFEVSADR